MVCIFICLFIYGRGLQAREPLRPYRTQNPPVIDGILNETVWERASSVSNFKTWAPDFGHDLSEATVAYTAYDRENLYFAFRCYDREPEKIKTSVTSRDNVWADDWVCLNLDSFNDQQSLYAFYINPAGIQGDSRFAAGGEDRSMDFVWYSAGRIDEEGWTVEIRIPLKSIRYANRNPVEMGIIFERRISRRSEAGTYPPLDPDQGESWLTQMHPMIYDDLRHYTLLEILPAVTYSYRRSETDGMMHTEENRGDLSLTGKFGITSDLILDGTYNPDFSQVEADAGQVDVNLRYDLYFPEKRPFFLEGRENFQLVATATSMKDPMGSIIHTRTIIDPRVGVKLAGKIGKKNTIASIYAMDEFPDPTTGERTYAHVPIVRVKRSLAKDSFIGGIYAGREWKTSYNRVAGMDGQFRITEASLLSMQGLMSKTRVDESQSATDGHVMGLHYGHSTRGLDFSIGFKEISKTFQADMGYIQRTGIRQFSGLFKPKFYPDSKFFRRIDIEWFSAQTRDAFSGLWETYNHASLMQVLPGNASVRVVGSYATEIFLDQRFKTGGFQISTSWQTRLLYLGFVYGWSKAIFYSTDPYQGRSNRFHAMVIFQPSDKIRSEFSLVYADFYRDSNAQKVYDVPIGRLKLTYQMNKYLFIRTILEYNDFHEEILTDMLVSFTYIPGTVIHVGYGALYDKIRWQGDAYIPDRRFHEMKRGFFFKTSYLWRL